MDEAPEFDIEEEWFIHAYRRLDKSRPPNPNGGGLYPIPISEYCAFFNLFPPLYEIDTTIDILQYMDQEVTEFLSKKQKAGKQKFKEPSEEKPNRFGPN